MVRRGELTDEAWERIAPLLPENGRRGKQWRDHRAVVDGILWKLRTVAHWRDLPERYGPWQTCYDRFVRWRRGIPHTIPERRDQRERRKGRPGRPRSLDAATYAERNVVERRVNKLKQWRRIATRYDKRALNYRAAVILAALMPWFTP